MDVTRLVPAAQQLITEVQRIRPKAKVKALGPADGLGFLRSVTFDAPTTKWLLPILDVVADSRIASTEDSTINFVADTRADHRTEFDLALTDEVLNGE